MVYITGDVHRDFTRIYEFTKKHQTTKDDYLIILGDVGINYYLDESDKLLKEELKKIPITLLCVQGNHEERPENINTYKIKNLFNGRVFIEEKYPNLIFLKDGEVYNINNKNVLVIGGAYSIRHDVPKFLKMGYKYFEDEQPTPLIKEKVLQVINARNDIDIVLTHTCPYKYEPVEAFYIGINQDEVDKSTEIFLDKVEEKINYKRWYCGHFHINKTIDKMIFLFSDVREFDDER
ncbi:MAG: metallophosphoesterase [Bacilli bacterium]|nr:metallophosphoesterase [Bacilli bacterium]